MSEDQVSPRVNFTRLKDFVGASHPIRMVGKVLNFSNDETYFIMEAPDGGKIKVLLPPSPTAHGVTDTYVEIIGSAVDASTIKFMACINFGPKLDLAVVNKAIEHSFDPKFRGKLF